MSQALKVIREKETCALSLPAGAFAVGVNHGCPDRDRDWLIGSNAVTLIDGANSGMCCVRVTGALLIAAADIAADLPPVRILT